MLNPFHDLKWIEPADEKGHESISLWKLILGLSSLVAMFILIFSPFNENISHWIVFGLSTICFIYIYPDFFLETIHAFRRKEISVDLLVAVAVISAYGFTLVQVPIEHMKGNSFDIFFSEAVIEILSLMYLGRYIEHALTRRASKELDLLNALFVEKAILLQDGIEVEINSKDIKIGDILIVKNGSKIPIDGVIVFGSSLIDDSAFTGEVSKEPKTINTNVFAGSIAQSGTIHIKANSTLENCMVNQIIKGIQETQDSKPKVQRLVDKISTVFIPVVFIAGIITFISWGLVGADWYAAFGILITVFVVACPCSFGIATPMSVLVSSGVGTKRGIIYRNKRVFEKTKALNAICFDKTGTLTQGHLNFVSTNIDQRYIPLIVSIEKQSNHPIAQAIVKKFSSSDLISNFQLNEMSGKGLKIEYENQTYFLGSLNFIRENVNYQEEEKEINLRREGKTLIYFSNSNHVLGHIVLEDTIKPEAARVIQNFKNLGFEVFIISGDHKQTTHYVASLLGIKEENIFAETLPLDKAKIISSIQQKGFKVAFVGDGINDAVALKQSDFGIAMGSGTDIAKESSEITLSKNDLNLVLDSIILTRKTLFNIVRGLSISIVYNAIMIPIAIAGLINPLIAGIAMMASDSIAVLNALTLNRLRGKKYLYNDKKKRK